MQVSFVDLTYQYHTSVIFINGLMGLKATNIK